LELGDLLGTIKTKSTWPRKGLDEALMLYAEQDSPPVAAAAANMVTSSSTVVKREPEPELSDSNVKLETEDDSLTATSITDVPYQATSSLEAEEKKHCEPVAVKSPRSSEANPTTSIASSSSQVQGADEEAFLQTKVKSDKPNGAAKVAIVKSESIVQREEVLPDHAPSSSCCTAVKREQAIIPEVVKSEAYCGRSVDPSPSRSLKRRPEQKEGEEEPLLKKKRN
jgi:hypothetical protein